MTDLPDHYRFVDVRDDDVRDDEESRCGTRVALRTYKAVRETALCYVLLDPFLDKGWGGNFRLGQRRVLKASRIRFAYPTIEEAKASFLRRKCMQIGYLERQLDHVRRALVLVEEPRDASGRCLVPAKYHPQKGQVTLYDSDSILFSVPDSP